MDDMSTPADCQQCEARLLSEAEALRRLNDASSRLWTTNNLQVGLEEMLAATIELLGADMGNVQLIDEATGKLTVAVQRGFGPGFLEFLREVSIEDGSACGRTLRSCERVIIEDVEQDPIFAPWLSIARESGFRAVQFTPVVDRNGKVVGMISTHFRAPHRPSELHLQRLDLCARQASDFIERCRREEELRQRAEEREALLDALPAFIWFGDEEAHVIQGNRAANEMTGVPPGANVSQSVVAAGQATYLLQLKEDGTECRPEELPIQTAIATRRPVHDVYIDFRFPEGRRVEVIGNAAPLFDASGAVRGAVGAFIDVSDRNRAERAQRESEEFNRTIIESSPDCVKVLDLDGRLLMINESGRRLLEIDEVTPLYGQDWRVVWPRIATREGGDTLAQAKAGRTCRFEEFHSTFKGTRKWWDVIVTPMRGSDGKIVRILSVSRDITDRKQVEDALRDADRRKDEFIATLAHELRNPLAPLRSGLLVLRKSHETGETAKHVEQMMERQVNHLVRLVDDLMDVSRITHGRINLKKEPADLGAAIRQAAEMTREPAEASGLELKLMLPAEPLTLDADPARLTQVFGNLLDNAVKYTPAGGRVEISAERRDGEAIVTVADTGVGIQAEMLPRVFDLFTQIDATLAWTRGGLGIGLALVRNIVQLHGGDVEAHSDGEGLGSRFIVHLPLSTAPARETLPSSAVREAPGPRRVLVIDDNPDVAESFALLLKVLGATVEIANDGARGLEAFLDLKPDLVFLDLGMPGMDGYETARRIRGLPGSKNARLIALTGWGGDGIRKRVLECGFDRHLIKPVEIEELEKVLEGSEDRDQAEP